MSPKTVDTRIRLAYALPAFAMAAVGVPLYVYIPKFYTDTVGVDIAVLGNLLVAARVLDGVTDPLLGYASDRTRTRFGRRRPYIAGASLLTAGFLYMLYNPPHAAPEAAAWWFAVGILALTFFWTSVEVPWESLGPEITFNYHERTSILAWRDGMLLAGTVAAIALPPVLSRFFGLSGGEEAERAKFFWFSVLYAPMLVAFCLWCAVAVPERVQEKSSTAVGVLKGLRRLLDNRPFLILLVSYTISSLGSNIPATLILYYVDYVLQSPRAEVFLLLYIATGIAFLPAWVALAKRLEKKTAWLAAMAMNTGAFVGVFFLGAGDEVLYGVLVFLSGIGFGATVALPSSMQADVIDYDELLTGRRREGQYIGIWSVSRKFAAAVGVGIALWVLGAAGYEPNREQSESVVFTLRTLYSLVPSLCNAAAFAIALAYPIDRGMHRRIRECIEAESGGDSCTDPLREGRTPKAGGAWSG